MAGEYTPSTTFEFSSAAYTPSTDFEFITATFLDLPFDGAWVVTAPSIAEDHFGLRWALEVGGSGDVPLAQRWALAAPTFNNAHYAGVWSLSAPAFGSASHSSAWMLSIPEWSSRTADMDWGLAIFDYADVSFEACWNIDAIEDVSDLVWRQSWTLTATAIWTRVVTSVTYTLTLTGTADSTTDLVLPMSNYRSELRSDQSSYLQATVPNGRLYSGQISARSNGELVISRGIRWSDGEIEVDEIARATLETIIPYVGSTSSSIALQARRAPVTITPQTLDLTGASYWSRSGNKLRYRLPIDNRLRPGDTARIDGNEFVVGTVQHTVGAMGSQMEIVEA